MQDYGGTFQWRRAGGLFQAGRDRGTAFSAAVGKFPGDGATPSRPLIGGLGAWRPRRPKNNTERSTEYTLHESYCCCCCCCSCFFLLLLPQPASSFSHLDDCLPPGRIESGRRFRLSLCTTNIVHISPGTNHRPGWCTTKVGMRPPPPRRALVTDFRSADAVYQQKRPRQRVVSAINQHEEENLAGSRTLGRHHALRP
jgi:hypothetical protein